jgi:hypothetical protein
MASDGPIMKVVADPFPWHCGRRKIMGLVSQNPLFLYVMLELMPKVLYAPKVLVAPPVWFRTCPEPDPEEFPLQTTTQS